MLSRFPRSNDGHFRGRLTVLISLDVSFSSSLNARILQRRRESSPKPPPRRSLLSKIGPPQSRSHNSRSLLFRHPGLCPSGSCEMEVLLTSRKPKFYCAVTFVFLLLGIISVWLGLLIFVAQMLRGILVPTETGLDGAAGYALVGEFMLTLLPVFTCCR